AVLAAVLVAGVDVEAAEADRPAWYPIVRQEKDHPRNADRPVDQADRIFFRRQIRPALEVERPILVVDRVGDPLIQERQRTANERNVDGKIGSVENQDLGIEYRR